MTPQIINLGKRFGLVAPDAGSPVGDITKRRKGTPDVPGENWEAWNAANPGHNPKDSRGRWTDNPVGRAIGQAISNVMARHGMKHDPADLNLVHVSDVRNELGDRFTRGEVDDELQRLSGIRHSEFFLIPQSNQKILTDEQRAGAVRFGNEDKHLINVRARDLPPADVSSRPEREPLPGLATRQIPQMIEIQRKLKNPNLTPDERARLEREHDDLNSQIIGRDSERDRERRGEQPVADRDPKQQTIGLMKDLGADSYDDWEDDDLAALRAHAATLIANVDAEQKRRKAAAAAARPKRATARLTAKPAVDYNALAADLRALPLVPESQKEVSRRLSAYTIPELRELGRTIDHPLPSKGRKADLVSALEDRLIGSRLTTDAVMHYDDPDRFARRRAEAAEAGFTSRADEINRLTVQIGQTSDKEQLKDLRARRAELIREAQAGLPAPTKPRTSRPGTSRPAANEALLGRLTKQRLQEVATRVGVPSTGKTKPQLIESINAATAGAPGTLRRALGEFDVPGDGGNFGGRHGATRRASDSEILAGSTYSSERKDWAASISNTLGGLTSVQEGKAFLGGFSKTQLQDLAAEVGVSASGKTKAQLIDSIIHAKITGPGSHAMLRRLGNPSTPDTSASLRNAEAQLADMKADLVSQYGEDPDNWPDARGDRQVEEYYDQLERVARMRRPSAAGGSGSTAPAGPSTPRSLPRSGHQWNWETIQEDNMTMHGDSASMELAQALRRAGREDDAQYVADMRYRISNTFGEHSPDDVERMVADLRAMMDRESDPKLRARYQRALEDIDAPAKPLPALPGSTPPVLRRVVDELNKIPNARRTGHFAGTNKDVSVVNRLADIIRKIDTGDRDALRGWQMQMRDALHSLHESVDGAMQMWRLEKLLDDPAIRSWVRAHYPKSGT